MCVALRPFFCLGTAIFKPHLLSLRDYLALNVKNHALDILTNNADGMQALLPYLAGSGALGFELLSRGCAHVTFVDKDTAALSCIKKTAASLGAERARHEIVRADSFEYAARMRADGQIRCVLLDPPYAFEASKIAELVSLLDARGVLAQDACIMYEHDVKSAELTVSGWQTYKTKRFGISAIQLLERAACES